MVCVVVRLWSNKFILRPSSCLEVSWHVFAPLLELRGSLWMGGTVLLQNSCALHPSKVSVLCEEGTSMAAQWEDARITALLVLAGRGCKESCEHPKAPSH